MSEGKPTLELDSNMVFCSLHGEPLRRDWPRGYGTFTVTLFQEVANDAGFLEELDGDTSKIRTALAKKPLCCRASKHALLAAYSQSGLGRRKICEACGQSAMGAPFSAMNDRAKLVKYQHVCFRCVVEMPANPGAAG